ncbi:transcriptional regulator [Actinoplanes ianthinogenes]|uniref:Transcriptional regulator n=1 Tax=Actinoplanes ianthinogenes TaxID=122358 RepID=A0ABN6CE02_9ACTN|nr:putative glycolipid-binding domain-containing protein [Actinoplanes ianthinogenes]BCJ43835.1 transcriptional regulator [Actinoplanes ianthinogenes]GGR58137.1 transcriptional regulator [Actinoplanes ianthinogenes]
MGLLSAGLFWERRDVPGAEQVRLTDRDGLYAQGTVLAAAPVGYACHYELQTDPGWTTARFDVRAEGAGWTRGVRLELAAGRWRVTTSEQGDLDAALVAAGHARAGLPGIEDPDQLYGAFDVDLAGSPLTNTLPIRRLGLQTKGDNAGVSHRLSVAWVLVPSLEVVQADQIYTPLDDGRIRCAGETFAADLTVDDGGFVVDYPGLARRITPGRGSS